MDNTTSSLTQQQQQVPRHEITRLIKTLEHATNMSRQLQITSDPTHIRLILTSLHSANISLSSFLDAANSVEEDDTMMMVVDSGGGVEEVDKVEEELRELLFIQNKRPKRKAPLSPSSSSALKAEREREEFDPDETRLRSFDLVYQFHA